MEGSAMPKSEPVGKHVQRLLHRHRQLLDELRSLAPKECADIDNEDWRLMFWRSALLAVDDALEPLEELVFDLELKAAATKGGGDGWEV
jgi:hypothetical protein